MTTFFIPLVGQEVFDVDVETRFLKLRSKPLLHLTDVLQNHRFEFQAAKQEFELLACVVSWP